MVTALETKERVEAQPITLEELGKQIGIPLEVRPWRESAKRKAWIAWVLITAELDSGNDVKADIERNKVKSISVGEVISKRQEIVYECPLEFHHGVKAPEVRNGTIVLWQGRCRYKPPGFVEHNHCQVIEVVNVAHRAVLVEIHVTGEPARPRYVLGIDGGHPFVTRVCRKAESVKEALAWLTPKKARDAIAQGVDVKRQGDWHFIPVEKPPRIVPDKLKHGQEIVPGSRHYRMGCRYRRIALIYNFIWTRHRAGEVVYNSVLNLPCVAPIVRGKVTAPDHEPLVLDDWHIAVRNKSLPWASGRAND